MAEATNETFWSRLKRGQLPGMTVDTAVSFDQESVLKSGAIIFVVVILIIASYFVIKKQLS